MTSPETGSLLTIRQAAARMHGAQYTESDVNRIYRMMRTGEILYVSMGARKFIPLTQIELLESAHDAT